MKLACFGIFIFIAFGIGFFWMREGRNASVTSPLTQAYQTTTMIPAAVGGPSGSLARPATKSREASDDIHTQLEKISDLARYALPTQAKRDELIERLSDPKLHSAVKRILVTSDDRAFDALQEQLRMNAVAVLGLILRYKDVGHRDEVLRWVKQRILAVDFHSMKDLRVKQSVYGDITELLLILRQHDLESFEELSQRIMETKDKALKTALAASR